MLGALKVELQELQVRPPQVGTLSTHLAAGSPEVEHMLRARMENKIMFLEGALIVANDADRFLVNMMKGLGLNLVALSCETLYLLQDGIMAELCARESRTI